MVMITVSIAAFVAASVFGYYAYANDQRAKSAEAKYKSIKEFADNAGREILKLKTVNNELSDKVVRQSIKLEDTKVVSETSTEEAPRISTKKFKRRYNKKNKPQQN